MQNELSISNFLEMTCVPEGKKTAGESVLQLFFACGRFILQDLKKLCFLFSRAGQTFYVLYGRHGISGGGLLGELLFCCCGVRRMHNQLKNNTPPRNP